MGKIKVTNLEAAAEEGRKLQSYAQQLFETQNTLDSIIARTREEWASDTTDVTSLLEKLTQASKSIGSLANAVKNTGYAIQYSSEQYEQNAN